MLVINCPSSKLNLDQLVNPVLIHFDIAYELWQIRGNQICVSIFYRLLKRFNECNAIENG